MTARAVELIAAADIIYYDRLIPRGALDGARAEAELVYVGKQPGVSGMSQAEINDRLVESGLEGLRVVRLKGGDPFLFGRGSEEAAALTGAGIRFEVVPGVTAGVAAPAYAGIPATHRGAASAVAFVTGHEDPDKPETSLDWAALAAFPGTLAIYMGVGRLSENAAALIDAGRSGDQPVAVIERGTTPRQRVVTGTLSSISALAAMAGVESPALIVVGEVVSCREQLAWFEDRPLAGLKVVVTRARPGAAALATRLTALGAEAIELPLIRIEPRLDSPELERTIAGIDAYDLVCLTSPNGVELLFEALGSHGLDARALAAARIAAIGPGTAGALKAHGVRADLIPERSVAEGLIEALGELRPVPNRVLLARAAAARPSIPDSLRRMEIDFDDLALYETFAERPDRAALDGLAGADWITFTSGSAAQSLIEAMPTGLPDGVKLASIGPVTSGVIRAAGLRVDAEAERHDLDGLIEVLLDRAGRRPAE
ncbi:MAG: uroporphyrinogen-III C-methyltransferase [Thermoleophilia bacterium]|nr:uroporphyrinogen-III C-methyltransferase [Thermoleophilia bacterium]